MSIQAIAILMSLNKMKKVFELLKSLIFGRTSIRDLRIQKMDPALFRECQHFFKEISVEKIHISQKDFSKNKW